MATYSTLSTGSSGDEVKKLQQALIDAGYDVGGSGADGIYGTNTQSAVQKYQTDNGLTADGIAGSQTLGALYGASTPNTAATATTGTTAATTAATAGTESAEADAKKSYSYDASSNTAYQEALAALNQAKETMPNYAGTYDQQLVDVYNQIVNRDKFSYDLNSDMLYKQYRDMYTSMGKLAMMDTIGQAASMTGGYDNSYAQQVGQQTYQQYLQQLNDVVPELYGMALDQYNAEGDALANQYALLGDLRDSEYGRYQDSLEEYWQYLSYLTDRADTEYSKGYEDWANAYEMEITEQERAWEQQQTLYSNLFQAIAGTGYSAYTDEELAAAGVSRDLADAWLAYYNLINGTSYTSSGSSGSGSGSGSSGSSSGNTSSNSEAPASGSSTKAANTVVGYDQTYSKADILGVDTDYLASASSSSSKQTQAGSTSAKTNPTTSTLSNSQMKSIITAFNSKITDSYGTGISTAKRNAYLKNMILYGNYSSAQKTQLLKYAGLM